MDHADDADDGENDDEHDSAHGVAAGTHQLEPGNVCDRAAHGSAQNTVRAAEHARNGAALHRSSLIDGARLLGSTRNAAFLMMGMAKTKRRRVMTPGGVFVAFCMR